jgi:hypothetical protein
MQDSTVLDDPLHYHTVYLHRVYLKNKVRKDSELQWGRQDLNTATFCYIKH